MVTREQLKQWFSRGMRPTGEQFATLIDSLWHKKDKVTASGGHADTAGRVSHALVIQSSSGETSYDGSEKKTVIIPESSGGGSLPVVTRMLLDTHSGGSVDRGITDHLAHRRGVVRERTIDPVKRIRVFFDKPVPAGCVIQFWRYIGGTRRRNMRVLGDGNVNHNAVAGNFRKQFSRLRNAHDAPGIHDESRPPRRPIIGNNNAPIPEGATYFDIELPFTAITIRGGWLASTSSGFLRQNNSVSYKVGISTENPNYVPRTGAPDYNNPNPKYINGQPSAITVKIVRRRISRGGIFFNRNHGTPINAFSTYFE